MRYIHRRTALTLDRRISVFDRILFAQKVQQQLVDFVVPLKEDQCLVDSFQDTVDLVMLDLGHISCIVVNITSNRT
jgi:hypothetical protein